MAFDEPTSDNIQHMAPVEHNTSVVPGTAIVDVDGIVVADAGGTVVVDVDGAVLANKDAMPIAITDYR
jgi:predicted regulator of Ras-like GTPase activity (Roadblock/LC7/MglB family)